MKINKVVIPVAGWGTRSLPATKNLPKEILPVFKKTSNPVHCRGSNSRRAR